MATKTDREVTERTIRAPWGNVTVVMDKKCADALQRQIDANNPSAMFVLRNNRRSQADSPAGVRTRQVEGGRIRDVRIQYNADGTSTTTPIGEWRQIRG